MNKVTATNKFLAQYGKVIDEPHKEKSDKNKEKIRLMNFKALISENYSSIGTTKKNKTQSKVKLDISKNSAKINRNKKRHIKTTNEKKATRSK